MPKPAKRATIYEVAERAGVSTATVSFALNRPDRVRLETRERVLAAADELGYVPRSEAVVRARALLGRIGVVAPFTSYSSYYRRLSGVLEALGDDSRDVCLFDHESAATATSPLLASLPIVDRLDGIIVMGFAIESHVADRLMVRSVPTVVVDAPTEVFSSVGSDDAEGGRIAARHLLELGHRRIGFLTEHHRRHFVPLQADKRLSGFREVLADAGIEGDDLVTRDVDNSMEAARSAAAELLELPTPPTAIVAHDDSLAVGVLVAARAKGVRVPEDLSIVGFDDGELAAALDLTTVHQPFEESGRIAARLLMERLRARDPVRNRIYLDLRLVRRGSTGPALA